MDAKGGKDLDVIGIGCAAADYLGVVARHPRVDEKMQMLDFSQQGGGLTATALVALARLGARASFISKLGPDAISRFIIDGLGDEGVATDRVIVDPEARGQFAFVMVERGTGKRSILFSRVGVKRLRPEEVDADYIRSAKLLIVDDYECAGAMRAAEVAREAGIPVAMDADGVDRNAGDLIALADFPVLPAGFAMTFTGAETPQEAASRLCGKYRPSAAVVTAGEAGCYCASADENFHQPAFKVEAVDTTGAGDVFHGGFAYGLLRGWPLRKTVRFAAAMAALQCTHLGGRPGIPNLKEVESFLRNAQM